MFRLTQNWLTGLRQQEPSLFCEAPFEDQRCILCLGQGQLVIAKLQALGDQNVQVICGNRSFIMQLECVDHAVQVGDGLGSLARRVHNLHGVRHPLIEIIP